ncbi:MAG: Calx-beta domain-containing protein [Actinomycetes bacterium]
MHPLRRTTAVLLLVLTTLAAVAVAAVAAAPPAPELRQPAGQPGTKTTDVVTFGGTIDPNASIVSGFLVFTDASGAEVGMRLDTRDRDAREERKLRADDDGNLLGSFQLAPALVDERATGVALEITVRQDGGEVTARSNVVEVDQVRPFVEGYGVISPTEVLVLFNEVVTYPRPVQDPTAWLVDGERGLVAAVEGGTSARRVLRLRSPLGEDATPVIAFFPAQGTASPTYFDLNGWSLDPNQTRREAEAKDLIPPVVPTITAIAGEAADEVVFGNDERPVVRVEDVTDGHTVRLFRETDGEAGWTDGDQQVGSGVAEGGAAEIRTGTLPSGRSTLYAVAVDPAGNVSEGADSAVYDLDQVVPRVDSAQADGTTVVVAFTESVAGTDRPADWTITFPDGDDRTARVTAVEGSGGSRTLTVDTSALESATITYTPTGAPYTDQHGNALEGSATLPSVFPEVPLPIVTIDDVMVSEGVPLRVATFTISLSRPVDEDVTIDLVNQDGTATSSSQSSAAGGGDLPLGRGDYEPPLQGSVTIPAGRSSTSLQVVVNDDDLDEFDETFEIVLQEVAGDVAVLPESLGARTGTGTIIDDDPLSLVRVGSPAPLGISLGGPSNVEVTEGGTAVVPITLDRESGKDITFTYEVRSDTAVVGADVPPTSGQVRIPAGVTEVEVRVPTIDDDLDEPDETVLLVLTGADNAEVDPANDTGVITILDDDPAVIVDLDPAALTRDGDVLTIPVRLRDASGKTVAVRFFTEDRSATAGEDYEAAQGELVFRPGETATALQVRLLPEGRDRDEVESFAIRLSEPRNAFLGTDEAVIRLGAAGDGAGSGAGGGGVGTTPGGGGDGNVAPGVDPGARGVDLPRTGGGLAGLGVLAMLGAGVLRRRR